jgi:hypothetical protein
MGPRGSAARLTSARSRRAQDSRPPRTRYPRRARRKRGYPGRVAPRLPDPRGRPCASCVAPVNEPVAGPSRLPCCGRFCSGCGPSSRYTTLRRARLHSYCEKVAIC